MNGEAHLFRNPGRTKLALVSRGVSLPGGLPEASRWLSQANATETVLDLRLPTGHFCTVPVGQPYTEASPIRLEVHAGESEGVLRMDGETLDVQLLPAPAFYRRRTRSGARMGNIAALHDRLLILHPFLGCGFFAREGEACRYCQYDSMLNEETPPLRDPLELVEVVQAAMAEREIDTVYLYNGYAPGADVGLKRLIPVIALLRRHLGHRQIALETVAPRQLAVIDELYAAGLDIFVCNLEVFDGARFAEVCPGKQRHGGQDAVWSALSHARTIFRPGSVVSHLIVGLEPIEATKQGMEALVAQGIVPLLVPFRPLPGTPLAGHPPVSLEVLEEAFLHLYALLARAPFPMHRLRHMGRVLTPMESRVLDGSQPTLGDLWAASSLARKLGGWVNEVRRHLRAGKRGGSLDRRPWSVLLLSNGAPFAAMGLLFALAGWLQGLPAPDGLDARGWHALIVFGVCLVLWVSQLLPLPITSLLGMAALPMSGVMSPSEVFALFGNPAVFFILGAFMLAAGLMQSGASEHLALLLLARFGKGARGLLLAMLLLPALMATSMPEHAVAAVFLPIVWQIVRSLGLKPGHPYAQALFLSMAWGAIIGGVATLLGGARGPLALALLQEIDGTTFSFLDWTRAALPIVLPLLLAAAWLQGRLAPLARMHIAEAQAYIAQRRLELGAMSWRARIMLVLMGATLAAWIVAGHSVGLASIALISVVAMFVLRLVAWRELESAVNWGVVLMYGGAIALGKALNDTGAASWLAAHLLPTGLSGWQALAMLGLATLLLTEAVSNAAAVAILLPIAFPYGAAAGLDAMHVAMAVGIVSGFAFMLPMGTPPNAMVVGTGCVRSGVMLRYGGVLSLLALLIFTWASMRWVSEGVGL
ncbi:MAG: DASS family sodium-coupled anion symporter [Zetaproteobacteria bacterium]|nr:MAG: DASS family sodium-coupled anion symporter [Zetaproteobacteria bacterium]